MKTNKAKFAVPVIAFMMAVGAAFATNVSSSKEIGAAPVPGYIHNGLKCISSIQCSVTGNQVCTVGGNQVFGMNPNGTTCDRMLFKL